MESTFTASWDSSVSTINSGYGINQWGASEDYEGADLMRLLNGYYIGTEGSTCTYCNGNGQEICSNVCDIETDKLKDKNMKPLTNNAKTMIQDALWYTGVTSSAFTVLFDDFYNGERSGNTSWTGLVGLVYATDIAIANKSNISRVMSDMEMMIDCYVDNWMFNSNNWTFSYVDNNKVWKTVDVSNGGDSTMVSNVNMVKPSVYLKPNIKIIGGNGDTEPYKLAI